VGEWSVASQSALILRDFPSFREVFDAGFAGCWEGELAPNARSYRINILYFPPFRYESGAWQRSRVSVRIVSPIIGLDPRGTGDRPPHIYIDDDGLGFRLCLYDPWEDDWRSANSIADTIIPWAAEWLFWFEAWLLTGVWSGGDASHEKRDSQCPTNCPSSPALPAQFRAAVSHRIGRETGTSVSFPLMAAASEGFSLPQYSRISRQHSAREHASPTISISPPALRLAGSLPWG
jgi:hypothetical protein